MSPMMPPETTYERYRRVLREIAAGAKRPAKLAAAALNSPKPPPTYQWRQQIETRAAREQARKEVRLKLAKQTYQAWLDAGRPAIARHARTLGIKRSNLERLLRHAEKGMPWGQKRLGWQRSRDYRTADELSPP